MLWIQLKIPSNHCCSFCHVAIPGIIIQTLLFLVSGLTNLLLTTDKKIRIDKKNSFACDEKKWKIGICFLFDFSNFLIQRMMILKIYFIFYWISIVFQKYLNCFLKCHWFWYPQLERIASNREHLWMEINLVNSNLSTFPTKSRFISISLISDIRNKTTMSS